MDQPATLDDILKRIDTLPTLSQVVVRVGELVNDPRTGARDIADAMRQDPSLSAKVLKLVNSPYYSIPGGVTDVARAISFIGFNTLHQLVLSASVLQTLRTRDGAAFDARGLWLHALAVGTCAEVVARKIGHRDPAACFTAGLLHDIGKVALAISDGKRYGAAIDRARASGISMSAAEREVGLPSHDRVGSRLARAWRFPALLMVPIEHHHSGESPQVRRELSANLLAMVDIVSVANDLCRTFHVGDGGSPPTDLAAPLDRVGLTSLAIAPIELELMKRLERSKIFLELLDEPAHRPISGPGAG